MVFLDELDMKKERRDDHDSHGDQIAHANMSIVYPGHCCCWDVSASNGDVLLSDAIVDLMSLK